MTRQEYLLVVLAEECAEVQHRISKALRFTVDEIQPEQVFTNGERIRLELNDLFAVCEMVHESGIAVWPPDAVAMDRKKEKVLKFMDYSRERKTLEN